MAVETGLSLAQRRLLISAALPITTQGPADECWLVLLENTADSRPKDSTRLYDLTQRKSKLLLPEYASRYWTILLGECAVKCHREGSEDIIHGMLAIFASLVRHRFLCVSLWLEFNGVPTIPGTGQLSSAWNDSALVLEPDHQSGLSEILRGSAHEDGKLRGATAAAAALESTLRLSGKRLQGDPGLAIPHPDAKFEATIATLADLPMGFVSTTRDSEVHGAKELAWRYQAAELLPQVHERHDVYRPDFLLDVLGIDVMDSAAGHYFLGRRRVLGLLAQEECDRNTRLMTNTLTWTQLLCENASMQLAAIRSNNERLQAHIDRDRSPSRSARGLIRSQYRLYQDLDEAQNIAVSLDPVFWHHQETLKQVSGLSTLSASLSDRFNAFVSASTVDEQRNFAGTAQTLTIVLSALALVAPTVQIAVGEKSSIYVTVALAVASALVGASVGLLLLAVMLRRTQH